MGNKREKEKNGTSRNCQVEYTSREQLSMLKYSIPNRHGRNVEQSNKVETTGQRKTIKGSTFFAFRGKKVGDIVDTRNGIMEGKGRRYGET